MYSFCNGLSQFGWVLTEDAFLNHSFAFLPQWSCLNICEPLHAHCHNGYISSEYPVRGCFSSAQYEQTQDSSLVNDLALGVSVLLNLVERPVLDEPLPKASCSAVLPWIWLELVFCSTDLVSRIRISSSNTFDVSIMIDRNDMVTHTFVDFLVIEKRSLPIERISSPRIQEFASNYYVEWPVLHYSELPFVYVRTVGSAPANRYSLCGAETPALSIDVGLFWNFRSRLGSRAIECMTPDPVLFYACRQNAHNIDPHIFFPTQDLQMLPRGVFLLANEVSMHYCHHEW